MLDHLAARAVLACTAVRERLSEASTQMERHTDRGDISTSTVIIWAATIGGALAIAGIITAVVKSAGVKLENFQ